MRWAREGRNSRLIQPSLAGRATTSAKSRPPTLRMVWVVSSRQIKDQLDASRARILRMLGA